MKSSTRERTNTLTFGCLILLFLLQPFAKVHSQNKEGFSLKNKEVVKIEGKDYVLLRGELTVPEDRSKPDSRVLIIPVQIIRAFGENAAEPIFWLDGGPGASNILSIEKIASASPSKLLTNHDFVCIGYRGVDGTTVLKSRKINKSFKGLHHKMLSDESLNNVEAKIKAYCSSLKKDGIDINQYTILNVIDDLDYARQLLGYAKINLLSASYGTRVALLYSYRYPLVIRRTIMIGACPPGYFLTRQEQAENIINYYDSLYKVSSGMEYKGSIKDAMQRAFDNLPRRWATFRLDADKIKAGTTGMLYARGSAVWAFNAYFKAANEGDFSELYMLQKIFEMSNKAIIGDVYAKTVSADWENTIDLPTREQFRNSSTLLGNNISAIYGSTAHAWSIKSIPDEYKKCRVSEDEVLVISGDLDFRTPADITNRELMPFLKNGKHIVLKNMSHSDILLNVMKSQDFLYQYFESGIVDESLIRSVPVLDLTSQSRLGKVKIFVAGLIM
ncbi:MAG: alpha/beta fold hydrolase [Cytophagales bacterium]|nr:alpha/beta fold hydrolase [Cytophagales bacterium]